MSIYGNIITHWWVIGLVVSLVLVLLAWAGIRLWKLMGPKLRLSLPVTYVNAGVVAAAADVLVGEEVNLYDEKNRLRSTTYLDGTFTTNHYPCCRLLSRMDREGRRTLRSAVTGEDHLYYAEEDVYLREISGGSHRITQHFLDALGRETNTVVYAGSNPGEAVLTLQQLLSSQSQSQSSHSSQSSQMSHATTAHPRGTDAYSILVDERGKTTATENSISTTYTANNLNQYTAILCGSESPCEPTYDADGNLTQDERYVYAYDCENRLVSVTPINPVYGDCSVENIYDPYGNIVQSTGPSASQLSFGDWRVPNGE